jgi:hypothetical protein
MQKEQIPLDVRNAVQNHTAGSMDELYGHHTYEAEKRDALDRWAKHIDGLLHPPPAANVVRLPSRKRRRA